MRRRDSESEPIVFRVLHLPENLREAIQSKRKKNRQTLKDFTWQVVEGGLAPLVEALNEVLPSPGGPSRPMRIPLSDRLLTELREAANRVNISSTRLLLAMLQLATQKEGGTGRRRGRKKQVTERETEVTPTEVPPSEETQRRGRQKGAGDSEAPRPGRLKIWPLTTLIFPKRNSTSPRGSKCCQRKNAVSLGQRCAVV